MHGRAAQLWVCSGRRLLSLPVVAGGNCGGRRLSESLSDGISIELLLADLSKKVLSMREIGKFLVLLGAIIVLLGLVLWSGFAPKWLGRLPGDIRIEREHSSFYFPIVTCVIISIVLSIILSFFRR